MECLDVREVNMELRQYDLRAHGLVLQLQYRTSGPGCNQSPEGLSQRLVATLPGKELRSPQSRVDRDIQAPSYFDRCHPVRLMRQSASPHQLTLVVPIILSENVSQFKTASNQVSSQSISLSLSSWNQRKSKEATTGTAE